VGEQTTAQVGGELAADMAEQATTVGVAQLGEQGLGVARDELVQDETVRSGVQPPVSGCPAAPAVRA
jgi:hypothetical protein